MPIRSARLLARELILPRLGKSRAVCERVRYLRDIAPETLELSLAELYRVLGQLPRQTSLAELAAEAQAAGVGEHFDAVCQREVAGKFQLFI